MSWWRYTEHNRGGALKQQPVAGMVVWTVAAAAEEHASVLWLLFPVAALAGCLVARSVGQNSEGYINIWCLKDTTLWGKFWVRREAAGSVVVKEREKTGWPDTVCPSLGWWLCSGNKLASRKNNKFGFGGLNIILRMKDRVILSREFVKLQTSFNFLNNI